MNRFSDFFRLNFRAQLIYGIGLFLTLLISVFIYIETASNTKFTRARGVTIASDHSSAFASMVQVWVMSNDYTGLEEVLENFSVYDDLVFAAVINMEGKIIAHSDKSLVGKYIADERRISFIREAKMDHKHNLELFKQGYYIDVLRVIHNEGNHIGFIHLRLDQHSREDKIRNEIYQGIGFGLLYLATTVLLLSLVVNTFTKKLRSLVWTMKKVHEGDKSVKADEEGYDELSELSREFNSMLDSITSGESELKIVKERLEFAINGTQDGLWDWNIEASEVYLSPRWKEMLGYTDSELPNAFQTWEERVHPDDIMQAKTDIALCQSKEGQLYINVHRIRHKNGDWVWILARGQTIFNETGKAVRMTGFHTDITRQKELERELLEQEELMIAQSRHVAMGEMIGMIAHQWRQPITVMAMGANNLLLDVAFDEVNNESIKKEAQEILKQTEYLSKTIDDFRNFFRPNKHKENSKIVDILTEAKQIMGKSLEYNNTTLSIESDEQESINTYSREMLQVFLNLFKNSQEAIGEDAGKAGHIDAKVEDKGDYILISVSDNGGGIEESTLNRIFEPYFSTKDKKTGTGLGLYMSKTIIEKHLNGSITAQNVKGGVRFTIMIPKESKEKHA